MFCANCGNQMSEEEIFCSQCGWRRPEIAQESSVSVEPEAVPVPPTPAQFGNVQMNSVPVNPVPVNPIPAENTQPGKKFPMGVLIGIAVGVVALVVIPVMVFSSATVQNWAKKTFSEPEEYYQWVEGRAAEEAASNAATIYNDYIRESLKIYDTSVSAEAEIELGKAGKDMLSLAGMSGVDMSWFEGGSVFGNVSVKDNIMSFSVGEADILSMAGILDIAEEKAYLQFPDLSDMYIAGDVDDTEEMVAYFEILKVLYENAPDKKLVEELLNKYSAMALTCVDDVEMSEGTIRAEGVTQDCVELEVTIDEKNVADMMETVMNAMAEDEDLKEWVIDAMTAIEEADLDIDIDMEPEEFYEELQDMFKEAADEADSIADYDMEIVMVVYVDSKGNICGRSIEYEGQTMKELMAHDGSDFGYIMSAEVDGETIAITGSGKDSGGKLTGEFAIKYNGMALVDINVEKLDTDKLKKGQLSGTFTIAPSSAFIRAMDLASYSSILSELSVVIEAESDANSTKLVCSVLQEEDKWGTVTLTASRTSGEKAKIPSNKTIIEVEDEEDFEDWYETIDWDAYIKQLKKAGMPSEIIDVIEEMSDMDADEFIEMF